MRSNRTKARKRKRDWLAPGYLQVLATIIAALVIAYSNSKCPTDAPVGKPVVINYWDFFFEGKEVDAVSTAGTPYRRTLRYGMPRLPSGIGYCPFYLYKSVEDAKSGAAFGGTGLFVGYPTGDGERVWAYAVTNWHVAVRDGASIMRVNKIGGGVDIFEYDPSDWDFIGGGPDIAVLSPTKLKLNEAVHEISVISLNLLVSEASLNTLSIGPGDDIFMLGRFIDHDGAASNVPAARFGNISVMPQAIEQPTGAKNIGSFILDVHSRTGYSGSPVFVYRTHGSDLTTNTLELGGLSHFIRVLGIHWGQFPEEWEIKSGKKPVTNTVKLDGDTDYVTGLSGMTLAVPAWEIQKFLDTQKFVNERDAMAKEQRKTNPASPVAESAAPPSTDVNPNHLEDFKRLQDAAARKQKPAE